jgi:pimeloyl-ACP methyl ester carboxylesterase
MADYVQLGDVHTWYDEYGEGEPLALLHPGGADARGWAPAWRCWSRCAARTSPDGWSSSAASSTAMAGSPTRSIRRRARPRSAMYRGLPDAQLATVPGTSHGLLREKPGLCNTILVDFLATDPVPTYAPVRRASKA